MLAASRNPTIIFFLVEAVRYLTKIGANVNVKYNEPPDDTPLHSAAENGNLEIVKCLIENGALINEKGNNGCPPLSAAVCEGEFEVVKFLIENGAVVNAKDDQDFTPLHLGAKEGKLEVIKYLIENGAKIESTDHDGDTPLHMAALNGHIEVVKCFIENGARIDPKNDRDKTPHFVAAKSNHKDVVEYLTKIKKRMAEKEPELNISSKDPCIICLEPRDGLYVLWPCGHTSLCEPCCINIFTSSTVTYLNKPKCPSCRKPITEYKQLFFQKPE